MKRILVLIGIICSIHLHAQTGIGTTTPNASAKLDVYSDNKGFLPPRVTLTSATDNTTIPTPAEGLLVYNKGSVGLQAGYYYWNGANWATIATATSAGNGVTASDMVKIYDGVGSATINTNGATFSVTTSGKYSFDFTTSAFSTIGSFTLNFQVRDGANSNAVIGSDLQTSYNNNVRTEYNGKVEVNLLAGRSYNVLMTASNGTINSGDYCRVYMKQVAGNLPVTGQTVDYLQASLSANQTLSSAGNIVFNVSSGAGITLNNGGFDLKANKTYKLEAALGGTSGAYAYYAWVDNANTILNGGSIGTIMKAGSAFSDAPQDKAVVYYTPTSNTTVYLRVLSVSSGVTAYAPNASSNYSSTWANITQIGSSAIVNPWVLKGNDVYNTTGKVGIGTNAPTTKLDVTGDVNVTGALNVTAGSSNVNIAANALLVGNSSGDEGGEIQLAKAATNTSLTNKVIMDVYQNKLRLWEGGTSSKGVSIDLSKVPNNVGGELSWKVSGLVDAGTFVQMDNLKVAVTTSGSRGLSVAAVSGSFVCHISGWYAYNGVSGAQAENITYTTTPSASAFGWSFLAAGNTVQYHILDNTNYRFYRITMMIGSGYINNFISIERLY